MEMFFADVVTHYYPAPFEEIEPVFCVTFAAVFLLLAWPCARGTSEAVRVRQDVTKGPRD